MKLGEVARFEAAYQLRRGSTWFFFIVFLLFTAAATSSLIDSSRRDETFFNAPITISAVTVLTSLVLLLLSAAVAGDAATRDAQTRIAPLLYTTPISKRAYLGGRFLGAFAVSALFLAPLPFALIVLPKLAYVDAALVGPVQPLAYVVAYFWIALPNAFISTAILFALAVVSRRAISSYVGAVVLFVIAIFSKEFLGGLLGRWTLANHLDLSCFSAIAQLWYAWTPAAKNDTIVALQGSLLTNRLLWLSLAIATLALVHRRFRFAHHAVSGHARAITPDAPSETHGTITRVVTPRRFNFATRMRQLFAITRDSLRELVASRSALAIPVIAALFVFTSPEMLEVDLGTPTVPATARLLLLFDQLFLGILIAAVTTFYAGELSWRDRDMRMHEIANVTPVPDWVSFLGKFLGLTLMLVAMQTILMLTAIALQLTEGYTNLELGVYVRVLFGLRLTDHLLFAAVAMAMHVVIHQKHVANVVTILFFIYTRFASELGIEHKLLIFGSDTGWTYSDISGFGDAVGPWLAFKLYWGGWALLLLVIAKAFWMRGSERRLRVTRWSVALAACACFVIAAAGTYVFYNTNVLNDYRSGDAHAARRAEYERRYAQYANLPQPRITATKLHAELYPQRGDIAIRGTFRFENRTGKSIEAIHLTTDPDVETRTLRFDRAAIPSQVDATHGYRIYRLARPLAPGEALHLEFDVVRERRGFTNDGILGGVTSNGTYIEPMSWLPLMGYQRDLELRDPVRRHEQQLPKARELAKLEDHAARFDTSGIEPIAYEATISTEADQTAVTLGTLKRAWTQNGRRYFHYVADAPVLNLYAFFSARYAVRRARWNDVEIEVLHHPTHQYNVDRIIKSAQASLDYNTREFGPYPHRVVRFVEYPSPGFRLRAYAGTIMYSEGFAHADPSSDGRGLDLPFAVAAHELGHQWWGHQLRPAQMEGAALLSESLAWYSGMMTVAQTYGAEHLERLHYMMRQQYLRPRPNDGRPLLRAADHFEAYRQGPFAMYALREYAGEKNINTALRRLLAQHRKTEPPYATSLDLYRHLQAVTPPAQQALLQDLLADNAFWELELKTNKAQQLAANRWRITLGIRARKVEGAEQRVAMDELVDIAVFGDDGKAIYHQKHRIRSGFQIVTVEVQKQPRSAGVDPFYKLLDRMPDNNVKYF